MVTLWQPQPYVGDEVVVICGLEGEELPSVHRGFRFPSKGGSYCYLHLSSDMRYDCSPTRVQISPELAATVSTFAGQCHENTVPGP